MLSVFNPVSLMVKSCQTIAQYPNQGTDAASVTTQNRSVPTRSHGLPLPLLQTGHFNSFSGEIKT